MTTELLVAKSHRASVITIISYLALIICLGISTWLNKLPEQTSVILVLVIKFGPLLIVLPGMLKKSLRAYVWLCFIVLFYFTRAVVDSFLTEGASLDLLITVLTVVLFTAAMMFVKWEKAQGKSLYRQ
jgi:uncharacterized membrane protein